MSAPGKEVTKMKFTLSLICALFTLALFATHQKNSTIVEFTSIPSGASVYLDGARLAGETPLKLPGLAPGTHHARFELKGYEPKDEIFNVNSGSAYINCQAELKPVKALLLVTSDPEGCELTRDGIFYGETPRLISTLDSNKSYTFNLKKNGYKPSSIQVALDGRTPYVAYAKLISDSGKLTISSIPAEADVAINGIVQQSKTPLVVSDVPKGRVEIVISKEGYETVTKTLSLTAGSDEIVSVQLEGKPGRLFLSSIPEGARFYLDDKPLGKAPQEVEPIAAGEYLVRAELEGYGTISRKVVISKGEKTSEEFRLESITGKLEIRTTPAEATVIVDGHSHGRTKPQSPGAETSEYMKIENLSIGEHEIEIKRDGYRTEKKHPKIEKDETTQINIRLKQSNVFIPNIEITTVSGVVYRGILRELTEESWIIELEKPRGITYPIPKSQIRGHIWLDQETK